MAKPMSLMFPSGPKILSAGPPPERHADRITAEMLRVLARQKATLGETLIETITDSKDGNPKAQQRMADRLRKAGASHVTLEPGKRGRYKLSFYEQLGWDPIRDAEIGPEDPIPEKPWVACYITSIDSKGRGLTRMEDIHIAVVLFISHHVLSRAAQRSGLRTSEHLMDTVTMIWNAAAEFMNERGWETFMNPPPAGHKVQLAGTTTHVSNPTPLAKPWSRPRCFNGCAAARRLIRRELYVIVVLLSVVGIHVPVPRVPMTAA
jgi:hypothetical protein